MKNDPRRSFWRAAGPLLGFWGIQLVMEFVIEFIIILPFMGEASSRMTQSGEVLNYQEMMNKYYEVLSPAFDKIIGGQVAIAGIAAAATLFLTVTLFVIDRKKEQIAGTQRMGVQKPLKNYWSLLVMGVIGSIGATCLSVMAQAVLVDPSMFRQHRICIHQILWSRLLYLDLQFRLQRNLCSAECSIRGTGRPEDFIMRQSGQRCFSQSHTPTRYR